jgi:hypothetical protein
MNSIISFPNRGPWGDAHWRGNCSGHVQRALIEHFRPNFFVDVCEGSGTSRDVCSELGIKYVGLDLHNGQDFTADYVLNFLDKPADMVFSHPPYAGIIRYDKIGEFSNPALSARDTSAAASIEEFLEKSRIMLLNQREATRSCGIYATLIGDYRTNGVFRSFQADFINMMPRHELNSVVIKAQQNCRTLVPAGMSSFVPLVHEYLLIWKRSAQSFVDLALNKLAGLKNEIAGTWRAIIRTALLQLGGQASLNEIYQLVEKSASEKVRHNPHWMAKIRQTLQFHFEPVSRGVWALPVAV